MAYRRKNIAPTIAEYNRQCAEAIDVEPVTTGSGKSEKVDKAKTKTKAAKALVDLRKRWEVPMQSWQDLYDTWPEHEKAAKKSQAVNHFADSDADADGELDVKEWTMADKARKAAEKAEPTP